MIVSFVMYFTNPVSDNEGLAKLRDAVDNNKKLGNLTVEALKIIHPVNTTTTASNEGSTGNPSISSQKGNHLTVKREKIYQGPQVTTTSMATIMSKNQFV